MKIIFFSGALVMLKRKKMLELILGNLYTFSTVRIKIGRYPWHSQWRRRCCRYILALWYKEGKKMYETIMTNWVLLLRKYETQENITWLV